MVEVPSDNAFAINKVGIKRLPFPFSLSWETIDGFFRIRLVGLRAKHLVDLLFGSTGPYLLVFDVAHYIQEEETGHFKDLAAVAADLGLERDSFTVGQVTSQDTAEGRDGLVLSPEGASRFLEKVNHHELKLLDVAYPLSQLEIESLLNAMTSADRNSPFLIHSRTSTLLIHIHDDFYLWGESRSSDILLSLAGRGLAHFVGEVLRRHGEATQVAEPPSELIASLIGCAPAWTLAPQHASLQPGRVSLGFSAQRWRLGDGIPTHVDRSADYWVDRGQWQIFPSSSSV